MATYYCGPGGNDANSGLDWANRKLTLNGCEDVPITAGSTVYVAPGVYREMLTCDVSGGAGSPITYIGDVTGEHTDGVGGVVRVTGSDNDQTATRASCITCAAQRNYRTFRGFAFDTTSDPLITSGSTFAGTNWIIEDCVFQSAVVDQIRIDGANQLAWTIRRCKFYAGMFASSRGILVYHTADVSNTGHVIEDCIFYGYYGFHVFNVGGFLVRNCTFMYNYSSILIAAALAAGQTITVNNCVFFAGSGSALSATALGEITENYNTIGSFGGSRVNVAVGANSNAYPPLFDLGILHAGAGQISGFRFPSPLFGALSQWSQLRAIADTGAATEDLLGFPRPVTAGKRSWGAVQYQPIGRETTTIQAGTTSLRLDDAGRVQFKVPTSNVATTISVYCYREANYAGTNPQMIIKQPGVADRVTTDAGAASGWNLLTDTFTPAASPGYVFVELVSNNTDAASPATNDCFFDTLTVTLGALGNMETWLWDTQVADWVAAAAGGGLLRHPGMMGNVNA